MKHHTHSDPRGHVHIEFIPQSKALTGTNTTSHVSEEYLHWQHLSYGLVNKPFFNRLLFFVEAHEKAPRYLLSNVSGHVHRGELVAILGGSGAGKSTLLNLLAGRLDTISGQRQILDGDLYWNGHDLLEERDIFEREWRKNLGYVEQFDRMYEYLTVKETLLIAEGLAQRQLPKERRHKRLSEKYLNLLGLNHLKDSMVTAGEGRTGRRWNLSSKLSSLLYFGRSSLAIQRAGGSRISGGERKRVSIGSELVRDPSWLFLDEPTSGLDSMTAYFTVQLLRQLATREKKGILLTIHQPRFQVLALFDKIFLLAKYPNDSGEKKERLAIDASSEEGSNSAVDYTPQEGGRMVFQGSVREAVIYFESLGYLVPPNTNPGDYFIDLINLPTMQDQGNESAHGDDPENSSEVPSTFNSLLVEDQSVTERIKWLIEVWHIIEKLENEQFEIIITKPRDLLKAGEESTKEVIVPRSFKRHISPGIKRVLFKSVESESSNVKSTLVSGYWFRSLWLIASRNLKDTFRNRELLFASFFQVVIFTLLLGLVFYQQSMDYVSIQNRIGLLFFFLINSTFTTLSPVLNTFPMERKLYLKEVNGKLVTPGLLYFGRWFSSLPLLFFINTFYGIFLYWMTGLRGEGLQHFLIFYVALFTQLFCAQGLGYLLGAWLKSPQATQVIGPTIVILWVVFAGNFVNASTLPGYLVWLFWISPIHYSYLMLLQNEFYGRQFGCRPDLATARADCTQSGEAIVQNLFMATPTLWIGFLYLVAIMVTLHISAFLSFQYNFRSTPLPLKSGVGERK